MAALFRKRKRGRPSGMAGSERPWVGWVESSTPTSWTTRCRYCDFSLSIARTMFPPDDVNKTRAIILRTRAGMIDHLAAKHLDKAMR
jgi:hypothetical protein